MCKVQIRLLVITILFFVLASSCKKNWLDAKPDKSLVVPSSIRDYQALLDANTSGIAFNANQNLLTEVATGEFYVDYPIFNSPSSTEIQQNTYRWATDIYGSTEDRSEWDRPYRRILYTNIVLEGIEKIHPKTTTEQQEWNQVKGGALFLRAYNHYDIAQEFSKSYDKKEAATDMGIPLRLSADFNERSFRSTVAETYESILSDLKQARSLLPVATPVSEVYKCRPTQAAASAMLARVYLSMQKYDSALVYANDCLQLYNVLIDYNVLPMPSPSSTTYSIPRFNDETIFFARGITWFLLGTNRMIVDTNLVKLYEKDDLRLGHFIRSTSNILRFYGSYDNSSTLFTGLATDEVYLIRAECYARSGALDLAKQDLTALLAKRYKKNTLSTINFLDETDALNKILQERRKELCFRGLRWSDL
ncbi:MAG TPA: RagB/SusD family nutrient uptake outer membrane protein, partial [Chitinophagaceae bacterium]|nr:RagB/SusD family nutrient uptake outer membrane protein [Chitinophagaceae bacterium]